MEEQKYYTPEHEDIRMGIDCELFDVFKKIWVPYEGIIHVGIITSILQKGKLKNHVRVPYLTVEQIQSEGWTPVNHVTNSIFSKNHYYLVLQEDHNGRITNGKGTIFRGTMRCINDLRLISKLLGI